MPIISRWLARCFHKNKDRYGGRILHSFYGTTIRLLIAGE